MIPMHQKATSQLPPLEKKISPRVSLPFAHSLRLYADTRPSGTAYRFVVKSSHSENHSFLFFDPFHPWCPIFQEPLQNRPSAPLTIVLHLFRETFTGIRSQNRSLPSSSSGAAPSFPIQFFFFRFFFVECCSASRYVVRGCPYAKLTSRHG